MDAVSQPDTCDSQSLHSPGASEASVAQSARSGLGCAVREEPAMISFEDDAGPFGGCNSTAGASQRALCFPPAPALPR